MKEIRFVKYNKTRKEQFQIKTSILDENGVRYVEKTALSVEGIAHIWSMADKCVQLQQEYPNLKVAKPQISDDGSTARFDFLEGRTIAELLGEKIQNGKAPVEEIQNTLREIYEAEGKELTPFLITPDFMTVFVNQDSNRPLPMDHPLYGIHDKSYRITNLDGLFENLLVNDSGIYCLDYEWVFDFPIPVHFVLYRILYYFYNSFSSLLNYSGAEEFLQLFGIDTNLIPVYQEMEKGFQHYVHGENQKLYLENYMHSYRRTSELPRINQELEMAREQIGQLKVEVHHKNKAIDKVQELQRLTNNHVTNLEAMIGDLRNEIGEQARTLTYLNRHEALIFKIRRKMGVAFNQVCPKGSIRRRRLAHVKNTLLHPGEYWKLYTTSEGKNRMEGDFKIGPEYFQHGRLVFPKEDGPLVSIIIPVYNQIHYTYLCLLSILEHTKDVAYEVIIADDVSTDATAQLERYVEHVVICRNETNQGFLRNCNNAAKSARGRYLMFLNNDTQVTEGWLSSLVNLIEADDSIGMTGSKLVYPDGRLQEAGGIIWSDGSGWNYGRLDDPDKPEYNYVKDVDYISGAAILIPVRLWKKIGGFDERYAPAYCEDSDLAFEVRKAGYRVVYQPLSKVIHYEGISNGTDIQGSGLKRYQVENSEKLREKWAEAFKSQCENNGNPDPFCARERSMGKRKILVIDHYVPTFDKDAGSKTTYQYLKMFLNKGYVVKFLGDNFLREEPYTTVLQQMGIEVLYGPGYQSDIWEWLRKHGDDISIAYLNRPHISVKYIDYLRNNTSMKLIYYGHDLHFLRESREFELTGNLELKEQADYWRAMELTIMRKVDMSYYPSYIERDAIHAIDPKIRVKDITAYVYEQFRIQEPQDFEQRKGILFVGGFAHPPNLDAALWFAREIYPVIRGKCQIIAETAGKKMELPKFYIVGSKATEEIEALDQPGNGIVVKGFVSDEELIRLYAKCRLVVAPLRYGAGVKGKVVEAIYHGAPIVTTSIGAEGIPEAKQVMLVENEPESFAQAAAELYCDTARCAVMSERTQEHIRRYFSMDAAWDRIEEDFR